MSQLVVIVVTWIFNISWGESGSCISIEYSWLSHILSNLGLKEMMFTNDDIVCSKNQPPNY